MFFTNTWAVEKMKRMLNLNGVDAKLVTPDSISRNMFFFGAEQHTT